MARIAQLIEFPTNGLGGMERVALQVGRAAEQAGHIVHEFTNQTMGPIRVFRRWPMLNRPLEVFRFARRHAQALKSYDIVIGHGLYGAFVRHPRRVYLHHNTFAGEALALRNYLDRPERLVAKHVHGTVDRLAGTGAVRVAVSCSVAREAQKLYHQTPHHIIHNAIDTDHYRPYDKHEARAYFGLPQDRWIGLVVGRVGVGKGVHTLNALAAWLPKYAGLALASPSVSPRLNAAADSLLFVQPVPYVEMPLLYSACDALVFPSIYESFGLVVIEALACGLPVIASRVGIVNELLAHEPTLDAMIVDDPHDTEAFGARVARLMEQPEIGRAQAGWGISFVREHFSLNRFYDAYIRLIADIHAR